jgi:DNA-binding transcriptional MerR regulator
VKSDWLTLTEVAEKIGIATKTIVRWEKSGKIRKSKRNWRGWRVYTVEDVKKLEEKVNSVYEYEA